MLDVIKKNTNLKLGIFSSTKEKVESPADELINKGGFVKEEKAEGVNEIFHKLEKKDKEFEEKTSAIVSEALSDIQVGTQKDIKELNKEIADLEKILVTNSNGNEQIHKEIPIDHGSKKYEKKYSQTLQ